LDQLILLYLVIITKQLITIIMFGNIYSICYTKYVLKNYVQLLPGFFFHGCFKYQNLFVSKLN